MSEGNPPAEVLLHSRIPAVPPELESLLEEIRDLPCASRFGLIARQIAGFGAEIQVDVRPLGVLFRHGPESLCELSLYGELFVARLGPGLAVEVRVRNEDLALFVVDQALRSFLGTSGSVSALP